MKPKVALVTGATSGVGYSAARQLGSAGWSRVVVTGRSQAKVEEAAARLSAESGVKSFSTLALDLDSRSSVRAAVAQLVERGDVIDFLLLNAGMVPGKHLARTEEQIEASQAPLIGHHRLTMGLLDAGLLARDARIVIAGAEPARGDMPMFRFTDLPGFAAKHHQGDRTASVVELLRSGAHVRYSPYIAYADAKLIVAWWAAALARRLPSAMAVYAVSPGSAPDTLASRHGGFVMKWLMMPMVKLLPGMSQTTDVAAARYLQAAGFGTDVSGAFYASAPRKVSGPLEQMRHAHLHDRASQEAAWQAVVQVSGVDVPQQKA